MDRELLRQLHEAGAIAASADGLPAVKVSLQYQPRLTSRSRQERREQLKGCFVRVAEQLAPRGAEIDLSSLSVLGQTVEAVLPIDDYDNIVEELSSCDVRVDPLLERDVTATK